MSKFWTPERVAQLVKMHGEGMSGGKIARAMGSGVTRNQVIGKCFRMGLVHSPDVLAANRVWEERTGRKRKGRSPRAPKAPPVGWMPRNRPPRPGPQNRPAVVHGRTLGTDFQQSPEEAERRRTEYRREGLSLVARVESGAGVESLNARPFATATGCKWPLAGDLFCCNRVSEGVYCPGHADVAYGRTVLLSPSRIDYMVKRTHREDGIVEIDGVASNDEPAEWVEIAA